MKRFSTQYGVGDESAVLAEPTRSLAVTALVVVALVGSLIAASSGAVAATDGNETTMEPPSTAASAADAPPEPSVETQQEMPAMTGPSATAGVIAGVTLAAGLFVRQQD